MKPKGEKQNLRKLAKLIYISLTNPDKVEKYMQWDSSNHFIHHYNLEILELFYPELQLIKIKPVIKNKSKELLSELKKYKVHTILVLIDSILDYKRKNYRKKFQASAKLITSDSDIEEAVKSLHQSIMTKIKIYASHDCIFLDATVKHSIKIFESQYKENK